jgi:hypothetical protein
MNKKVQFFTIFCMVSTLLQPSSDRPLTLPESLLVGGLAAVMEVGLPGQILANATNLAIRNQPFVPSQCYQGFTAHAMGQMPIVAVQNMVDSQGTQALQARQNDPLSDFQKAGVAAVSGAAASLIDTPSNAVQLFLQRPEGKNKTNMQACKELGVKGLTRGATVNAGLKEVPFVMAYKFATPKAAKFLQEQGVENKLLATAVGGACVGVVTAVVTQPGAVIRGTMQNDPHADVYKTARQTVRKIYERDGAQGFFRGLPQRGARVAIAVPLLVMYGSALEKCVKDR